MGQHPISRTEAETLAKFHGTTERSIYRYAKQGVDVRQPLEVVDRIINAKNPSVRQLQRSLAILKTHIKAL